MENNSIWYLKRFNIFSGMNEEEMEELSRMIDTEEIKRHEMIYLQGDPARWVYFLKKGLVQLSRVSATGRSVTVDLLKPGEIFGELSLEKRENLSSEAVALQPCTLCRITRSRFEELLETHRGMVMSVNKILGFRLRKVENAIQDLLFLSVPARLAKLIDTLLETNGRETAEGMELTLRLTHQDLANLVGATREMVSNVLGKWTREGIAFARKRQLVIPQKKRLQLIFRVEESF